MILPRYPVYIPSNHRPTIRMTAAFLERDGVPFRLVIEPDDYDAYAARWGAQRLIVTPFQDLGQGAVPVRNFIKAHSITEGHARHWQLDDNMRTMRRLYRGKRIPCNAGPALAAIEDLCDRYQNVALAAANYTMFLPTHKNRYPPFYLNHRIYSCTLVNNAIPHAWKGPYNDDTDLTLQVLADGWCTFLVNVFSVDKIRTMQISGGMTGSYQGDGRLRMAKCLERRWPGVVTTDRRFQRPQHRVAHEWGHFDNQPILKEGIDLAALPPIDEYGLSLQQVAGTVKSGAMRRLLVEAQS